MRTLTAIAATLLLGLLSSGTAHAHPVVDEGIRQYQEAQFEAALEAFARAEAASDLTREDLTHLLLYRALVHSGLGAEDERDRALLALASLEPEMSFDQRTPPVVRQAFEAARDQLRGPLRIESRARTEAGAVHVEARAVNDPASLVRAVRVAARVPGGEWLRAEGAVSVPSTAGLAEHYAELVGPGGAVLARAGSPESPRLHRSPTPVGAPERDPLGGAGDEDDEGGGGWLWVGIGGAVVAVAAVVAIVLVVGSGPGDATQVDGPAPL